MKLNKYYCSRCSTTIEIKKDVPQFPTFCAKTQSAGLMIQIKPEE